MATTAWGDDGPGGMMGGGSGGMGGSERPGHEDTTALQPHRAGVYVNFLDSDDDATRIRETAGRWQERLGR